MGVVTMSGQGSKSVSVHQHAKAKIPEIFFTGKAVTPVNAEDAVPDGYRIATFEEFFSAYKKSRELREAFGNLDGEVQFGPKKGHEWEFHSSVCEDDEPARVACVAIEGAQKPDNVYINMKTRVIKENLDANPLWMIYRGKPSDPQALKRS
jgi:hypothetical protein